MMETIRVISTKYDGSLRDEYESSLVEETEDTITLFSLPGTPFWDHRKEAWFDAPDGLIEIYFKHRWFNVWHICEQKSNINVMYVNIAMPPTMEGNRLTWMDMDLDYRVHLDRSVERLDQDEFDRNAREMEYLPVVIEQAEEACREVERLLAEGSYPFDYERQVALYQRIKAGLPPD
jgi:uncharacterized protein